MLEDAAIKRLLKIATETGKIMLIFGAETYRVEDSIKRMIESRGAIQCNVFVIPTSIIVSVQIEQQTITSLERVSPIGIDLERIDRANAFARDFGSTNMSLDEAETQLYAIQTAPTFSKLTHYFYGGMAGGFFVLLFHGNFLEFAMAYMISSVTLYILDVITHKGLNFFIKNIIGSFLGSMIGMLVVVALKNFGYDVSFDKVIIGPLMTMVPGVALTTGIRDLISGELVAGSAKIMEALFVAIALAFGVGMVLQFVIRIS